VEPHSAERPAFALLGGGLHLLVRSHVASLASGCAERLRNAVREKNHVTALANKQNGGGGGVTGVRQAHGIIRGARLLAGKTAGH